MSPHRGGDSPSFVCSFPITPEATASKLAPLIWMGGCSLLSGTKEHCFPSPLRGDVPKEIRIRWLRHWDGEGKRVPAPNHTTAPQG